MGASRYLQRAVLGSGLLLTATLFYGCAGLEPFEPRNDRVEGPERGLFSGRAGEFVIFRRNQVAEDRHREADHESGHPK
jgi:hypothetical protein